MRRIVIGALFLVALLALPATTAQAAPPAWSYVEGGYNNVDLDGIDDGGGWFLGGSFGGKNFHVFGRYNDSSTDDFDIDVTRWWAGAGWHGWLGEKADLIGELAYINDEVGPVDDDGYFARVGARWRIIKLFEIGGWYRYQDTIDSESVWEANAIIHLWRIGIGLTYETADSIDTYNAFVRFNFK